MDRHKSIALLLQKKTFVSVYELCGALGISPATARRDLSEMERAGLLKRVRGGAVMPISAEPEPEQDVPNLAEKRRIADRAVSLVAPGDTIFLDSGSTNIEISKKLASHSDISVITNSITIAYLLDQSPNNISVFICGGNVGNNGHPASVVGPVAEMMISQFRATVFFMGSSSIDLELGVTDPHLLASSIKQKMMQSAAKTILVADHTKFAKVTKAYVCALGQVSQIITDDKLDPRIADELRARGHILDMV